MHSQLIAFGAVLGNVFLISLYMQAGKGLLLSHPRYPQNQRTSHRYATARKYLKKLEIGDYQYAGFVPCTVPRVPVYYMW
jgi:hypothetical protein